MQHVSHGLWIASIDGTRTQSTQQFDLVVSVCQDAAHENVGCAYEHYPLADDAESVENWGGSTDYALFTAAAERVVNALRDDSVGNVLVHCHHGKNRSAAVCAAAIAAYRNCTYTEAITDVLHARPVVAPNNLMRSHAMRFISDHT
jgi:protein-tyrosine phosphatase